MKLLIARSNFFSYSETFIDQQIRQLNPHAVLYEGWQPSNIHAGGSIYPFPLNLLIFRGSLRNLFPAFYQKVYTYFLKKYLQKTETACLLANYGPLGMYVFTACQESNIPFVVHFHGFDASEKKTIARYGEEYRKVLPLAKAVIVVSQVMKMDIEGAEWEWFANLEPEVLKRFKQLVVEFHCLGSDVDYQTAVFKKLSEQFYLIHIHGNNHAGSSKMHDTIVPSVIELTYVRKDDLQATLNTTQLPRLCLDAPNCIMALDFDLSFPPFVAI
jgi:hypothetical protein